MTSQDRGSTPLGSTINETFGTADFRSTYSYYANSLKKRQTTNGCHFSFLKSDFSAGMASISGGKTSLAQEKVIVSEAGL